MTALALLLLMMAMAKGGSGFESRQPPRPVTHRPAHTSRPQRPRPTQNATVPATSVMPMPTPAQAAQVKKATPPWPQAMPAGLPPFPSGWQPAQPPPAAVVTRAWALLPVLWKGGQPGQRVTEQTAGNWYTYVASWMNAQKTMKGVVAYKPKGGAVRQPPKQQPRANA